MNRTIKPEELKSLLTNNKDVVLLDVRRKSDLEMDRRIIPGAEWRDPEKVGEWSADLPKDKELVLYCLRGGSVSNQVLDQLLDRKIAARYLEGGITAWKAAGEKTE